MSKDAILAAMLNSLRSLSFSTRTLLMVLLVLGTLLRSGIALAGELHAVEHQVQAALSDNGSDHGHDHVASAVFDFEESPQEKGSERAKGLHALLHQCCGVSLAVVFEPDALTSVPAVSPPSFYKPDDFSSAFLATPFRPPIA